MSNYQGKVKFFDAEKGYGFLIPDGGGGDVFVHAKELEKTGIKALDKDQLVSFDIKEQKNGKTAATNIRFLRG